METLYFKVDAGFHNNKSLKSKLVSDDLFEIERDKKGRVQKAKKLKKDPKVPKEKENKLDDDGNITGTIETSYPELIYQAVEVFTRADGSKITYAFIPGHINKDAKQILNDLALDEELEIEHKNPHHPSNLSHVGYPQFISWTKQGVYDAFPETEGQKNVGTVEEPIMVDKLFNVKWSGENL
jgi:hypothetical protein